MTILGLLAGALLSTAPAQADDAYIKCVDGTSTNFEWGACGGSYLKQLDGDLNAAWKKAYASVGVKGRPLLLQEQRAWVKFKDASCQVYANGDFGREGQVLHFFGCRGEILNARISTLKGVYRLTHQDKN